MVVKGSVCNCHSLSQTRLTRLRTGFRCSFTNRHESAVLQLSLYALSADCMPSLSPLHRRFTQPNVKRLFPSASPFFVILLLLFFKAQTHRYEDLPMNIPLAVVRNLSSNSKVVVWTIGSRMKKPTEIAGSRWLPWDRMSKMDWLYRHLARVPGVSYSFFFHCFFSTPSRTRLRFNFFLLGLRDIDTVRQQRNSIVYFSGQSRVLSDFHPTHVYFLLPRLPWKVALAFLSLAAVMLRCLDFFFNLRRVNHGTIGSWLTCAPTRVTFDYPVFITFRMHGFPSPKQLLQNSVPSSYHSNGPPLHCGHRSDVRV